MRWPFGPPHLTLKPSNKNTKKKKTKKKNKRPRKKRKKRRPKKQQQKHQKMAFQLSVKFFLFLVAFQNFPFLTSWPRKPEPQKHYKNRGFKCFFWKPVLSHETADFGPKKPKIINSSYHFFLAYFLLFQKQKTQKLAETPIFIVF